MQLKTLMKKSQRYSDKLNVFSLFLYIFIGFGNTKTRSLEVHCKAKQVWKKRGSKTEQRYELCDGAVCLRLKQNWMLRPEAVTHSSHTENEKNKKNGTEDFFPPFVGCLLQNGTFEEFF